MATYGFYDAAGLINWTNSVAPTDQKQLDALAERGISFLLLPDGANGSTGMIVDGAYVAHNPAGAPVPSPIIQYIAAQINSGAVDSGAFHPVTLAQINQQLTAVNLTAVAVKPA